MSYPTKSGVYKLFDPADKCAGTVEVNVETGEVTVMGSDQSFYLGEYPDDCTFTPLVDPAPFQAALVLAVEAMEAVLVMSERAKPRKLDEALSWRENDILVGAKVDAALAAAGELLP